MSGDGVREERVQPLNGKDVVRGDYVLYWMQQSQRAEDNPALEYAVSRANALDLPLLVVFGLTDDYPEANLRHHAFMLEGLRETQRALEERGIKMLVRRGSPEKVALEAAKDAALVVCDRGYLHHQRRWREEVARGARCEVVQVESDVVVPIELASEKRETAARTLRPKIKHHLEDFLVLPEKQEVERSSLGLRCKGLDLTDAEAVLRAMDLDRSVPPVGHLFRGGTKEAGRLLERFLREHLSSYARNRNQPHTDDVSHMSKYLHFGQISPVYVALRVLDSGAPEEDVAAFLEELVVRRELAINFVFYTPDYHRYSSLPEWARRTLAEHRDDEREHIYTRSQLEDAATHDPYWNAAMNELRHTGYMHNHMRMYWGKKILEWTGTPEYAYRTALYLNNRYFLDGRDPNSYANVGWVFGLHDRGWPEREIFGKVRYMSEGGLRRKTDPDAYVRKVRDLVLG